MNKFLTSVLALLVLAVGGLYLRKPIAPAPVVVDSTQQLAGAAVGPDHYTEEHFYNGLTSSKMSSTVTAVSSTTPAALGAASSGFIAVPTATLVFNASSTAIGPNSMISIGQIASATSASLMTSLGPTLCNTNIATTTPVYKIFASSTNSSVNGFSITLLNAPQSTPLCLHYRIFNYGN